MTTASKSLLLTLAALSFGENRSFDHVFGTYVPRVGQTVWNLASLGIVNPDGTTLTSLFSITFATDQLKTLHRADLSQFLCGGNILCR